MWYFFCGTKRTFNSPTQLRVATKLLTKKWQECRTCRESPEKWARFSDGTQQNSSTTLSCNFLGGYCHFRLIKFRLREKAAQDCQIRGKECNWQHSQQLKRCCWFCWLVANFQPVNGRRQVPGSPSLFLWFILPPPAAHSGVANNTQQQQLSWANVTSSDFCDNFYVPKLGRGDVGQPNGVKTNVTIFRIHINYHVPQYTLLITL